MDIRELTCGELVARDKAVVGIILVWVDEYYVGKNNIDTFTPDRWKGLGEVVGSICKDNPKRRILDAIDKVIDAMQGR